VQSPRRVPNQRSRDAAPPSLRGVQEGPFPRLDNSMGRSDSRPSLSPHFVAFAWRYHPCVAVRSQRPRRAVVGSGELIFRFPSRNCRWRRTGLPGSQGPLVCLGPVLRPRRDRARQAMAARRRGPRSCQQRGLPRVKISGLDRRALGLAVYASQSGSPLPAQDSLPAAGPTLPDGIGYPQGSDERFHITILLSRASWRNVSSFCIQEI
jgi:hypothetical protein